MRTARRFETLEEALAALWSPAEADRIDASEVLGDVLERGILLPTEGPIPGRTKADVATGLIVLVEREQSHAVLESALHSLMNAEGDLDLPWDCLIPALQKLDQLSCLTYAIEILAATGAPRNDSIIRPYLAHHDPSVRRAAADGLENLAFRAANFPVRSLVK